MFRASEARFSSSLFCKYALSNSVLYVSEAFQTGILLVVITLYKELLEPTKHTQKFTPTAPLQIQGSFSLISWKKQHKHKHGQPDRRGLLYRGRKEGESKRDTFGASAQLHSRCRAR